MDPLSMEKAMLNNMFEKTGKNIEDWLVLINSCNFFKHGEIVKYLKTKYSLTHGYANLIARKYLANN
ncbi:MAG: hypothetical protein CMG55_10300 [Candidatus Marinimicrobia bacterium]|nr:hypothetical protein [Candidatus Neomarinimicrobiota bacterium]|tara:strand:- start:1190 stop:1390 length:201 start_codon:yes stop_codon:yes gene_type:complete